MSLNRTSSVVVLILLLFCCGLAQTKSYSELNQESYKARGDVISAAKQYKASLEKLIQTLELEIKQGTDSAVIAVAKTKLEEARNRLAATDRLIEETTKAQQSDIEINQQHKKRLAEIDASIREIDRKAEELQAQKIALLSERSGISHALSEQDYVEPDTYDQVIARSEGTKMMRVYVHNIDRSYHLPNCRLRSANHTAMPLHIISAAYLPCASCHPPIYYPVTNNVATRYFIKEDDRHYHNLGCQALATGNSSTIEIGKAKAKYTPCPVCRPPLLVSANESESDTSTETPSSSTPRTTPGTDVHVKGYYRKDGTYVRPHTRSAPGTKKKN
ncbi:MAG TPA: hypothetical protein VF131_22965 [Blastocatellia bacterium]|nr:hypothetical protein [Blastocatellia bacterium]